MALSPGAVTLAALEAVWRGGPVRLDPAAREGVEASRARVAEAARGAAAVYGVNTGFGKLAHVRIGPEGVEALQRNLVRSHCAGVGAPLSPALARLMMALKILSLGRGASGVRWAVVALLEAMIARGVIPVVPHQGSVGASGDLAPLAHMASVMIGEGEAWHEGRRMPGVAALAAAGLEPLTLDPKEGLALLNGTQFSTACALAALLEARTLLRGHVVTGALATDAVMGSTAPLRPEIHRLRGQPGQIAVAAAMRAALQGSEIRESHREGDARVQDPYCIRCAPQVAGACLDVMAAAEATLVIEANAATDNPLVVGEAILSGGNFHAEPVGFAADLLALALAELGSIAQRRVAMMVDPALSFGLPAFLVPEPGLHSGLMIAEVTAAALMSENKHLATPCVTDSTPTSANQEDHVSMSAHGAFRLMRMAENLAAILGVEAIAAAEGVERRAPLGTSPPLRAAIARLREAVPPLREDRPLSGDIEAAAALLRSGALADAAGVAPLRAAP